MRMNETDDPLQSYRCICGKLLFKGFLLDSTIQIKCKKCGKLMSFQGLDQDAASDTKFGMMFDRYGDVVSASSNIHELFGYHLSDLLSKNYGDLLFSGTREIAQTGFKYLWSLDDKEKYFFRGETTFKNAKGQPIPGTIQSKFVKKGDEELLYSVFDTQPMTETLDNFVSLNEYPFLLRIDPDGVCIDATAQDMVGKPFVSILQESEAEQRAVLSKLKLNSYFRLVNRKVKQSDETSAQMDVVFTPNFDEHGRCIDYEVFAVHHDPSTPQPQRFALNSVV